MMQRKISPGKPVFIYNPNSRNPYAHELGLVLHQAGYDVKIWSPTTAGQMKLDGLRIRRLLAPEVRSTRIPFLAVLRRFLMPLILAMWAGKNTVLIVAWTRDAWDAACLRWRASAGGKTIMIYHNPRQVRLREGRAGEAEQRLLTQSQVVVVHSEALRSMAALDFPNVRVAVHPPFQDMVARKSQGSPARNRPVSLAYLGTLRADKGADQLIEVAELVKGDWELRFLGSGPLEKDLARRLTEAGVRVRNDRGDYRPSDDELVLALSKCHALFAPYTAVSTSGSMLLARSLGLPVLALRSQGMVDQVDETGLADSVSGLGELVTEFVAHPWVAPSDDLPAWKLRAAKEWEQIVEEAHG